MRVVHLYADGACRGNGNENALGGYGFILLDFVSKKKKEGKLAERGVTNNIMELRGVIDGLKVLKFPCEVKIFTDSQYVVNGFNKKWIYNWERNNWRTASKSPVKNKELWMELLSLTKTHNCEFNWVKGHNNNEWNEHCDKLANLAMDEL